MAVIAQTGVFAFAPQATKGTPATEFYKHRASDIDLAPISDDRLGPPEVGGVSTPTIPYRAGVICQGGALINPRLENTIGWLLNGALGLHSTVATDKDVLDATVTGLYNHEFTFSTDQGYVPWMTYQKTTPGTLSTEYLSEIYTDCKIVGLTLALPNDGLITARVDVMGRKPGFDDNPSVSYLNTNYEDYESLAIGSVEGGFLKVPGFSATALPISQATVTLQNAPLDIRQERVYGSPYLEDVTIVGRQLTVDVVLKWTDPQLYMKILTGSTTGTQWVAQPFVSDLDVAALSHVSPSGITPTTGKYGLRVRAPSIMYQVQGGIRLAGGQAVMMRLTGTALANASYYCKFNLANKQTDYSWPSS